MTIKIGDVDVVENVLDIQFRLSTIEFLLDEILSKNPQIIVSGSALDDAKKKAINKLQTKYPNMGLHIK